MIEVTSETKEQAHDRLISPLITEIIEICQKYKIQMIASFDITSEEEEQANKDDPEKVNKHYCTTCIIEPTYGSRPLSYLMASDAILRGPEVATQKMMAFGLSKLLKEIKKDPQE